MDATAILKGAGLLLLVLLPALLGMVVGRLNRTQLARSWLLRWQQLRGTTVFEDAELVVLDKPAAVAGEMPTRCLIFKSSPGLIQSQARADCGVCCQLPTPVT